jgi:hypothetical protein
MRQPQQLFDCNGGISMIMPSCKLPSAWANLKPAFVPGESTVETSEFVLAHRARTLAASDYLDDRSTLIPWM